MKNKTVKIKVYCHTGFTGCNHDFTYELPKKEWDNMSEDERNEFLNNLATENMHNHIDYGAHLIDEEVENVN